MTIDEAKQRRESLQTTITTLVREFERTTGVTITSRKFATPLQAFICSLEGWQLIVWYGCFAIVGWIAGGYR